MTSTDRISWTVLGLAAIGSVTYLLANVDPVNIREWGIVLAPVLPALALFYQNYRADKARKNQIEGVHQAVNSQTKRELDAKGVAEYIRGQAEMLASLRPLIAEAVAAERLAAAAARTEDGGINDLGSDTRPTP